MDGVEDGTAQARDLDRSPTAIPRSDRCRNRRYTAHGPAVPLRAPRPCLRSGAARHRRPSSRGGSATNRRQRRRSPPRRRVRPRRGRACRRDPRVRPRREDARRDRPHQAARRRARRRGSLVGAPRGADPRAPRARLDSAVREQRLGARARARHPPGGLEAKRRRARDRGAGGTLAAPREPRFALVAAHDRCATRDRAAHGPRRLVLRRASRTSHVVRRAAEALDRRRTPACRSRPRAGNVHRCHGERGLERAARMLERASRRRGPRRDGGRPQVPLDGRAACAVARGGRTCAPGAHAGTRRPVERALSRLHEYHRRDPHRPPDGALRWGGAADESAAAREQLARFHELWRLLDGLLPSDR